MTAPTGLIERQFQGFLALLYRDPAALPQAQVSQLRQAFYAGAAMYQGMMLGQLDDGTGVTMHNAEVTEALFNQYADELEEFSERCVTGMDPARGATH